MLTGTTSVGKQKNVEEASNAMNVNCFKGVRSSGLSKVQKSYGLRKVGTKLGLETVHNMSSTLM